MLTTRLRDAMSSLVRKMGFIVYRAEPNFDMEEEFIDIYKKCQKLALTTSDGMYATYKSIEYIVKNKIPGDIVECGVFKGGSAKLIMLTLQHFNDTSRRIYLYDTYEGMPEPTAKDLTPKNESASIRYNTLKTERETKWMCGSLEEVQKNVFLTNYPQSNIQFVKGKVEDTIPGTMPESISLLRLDTDFYESTYHEFKHFYPALSKFGIVIIDDYGYWKGSKEATDQYFKENNITVYLNRIDSSGRIAVKVQ